ncbi:LytTR family transcriptional regulator [Epilithonimonas hungarica]|uniref:Cache domain-containing protein n=1 Tax=Epilithonimonas hungarica TaxID=454006 RepID=A0A1G7JVY3_9FLAO|nr:LytTR family transcriptional regulator [Epilithonimonas hungarica]SDF28659.1 hypothetical protein SAMN05421825_1488 [Epilithonimonas hungarica]
MKRDQLYLLTFITISILILICSFFSFRYLYQSSKNNLLSSKLESGKRESREVGKLLELQLREGISPEKVIQNLQNSIVNTDTQSGFICMYNTKGIELCHPDPALIGQKIDGNNSGFLSENNMFAKFSDILTEGKGNSGIRNFPESKNRSSEIVSVYPVSGSNWMLASHANIEVLNQEISALYKNFLLTFLVTSFLLLGISFFVIRLIYQNFEKEKNREINNLNLEVNTLSALNQQLKHQQEKLMLIPEKSSDEDAGIQSIRKRINIYHKDELISLEVSDISYFAIEDNSVMICTTGNRKYYSATSLMRLEKPWKQSIFIGQTVNLSLISKRLKAF